jgi:dihydroorotate dehydrogenase (fumarate)
MMTSALLRRGIDYLQEVEAKLVEWMADHEYASIREMQGSMNRRAVTDPEALERANYLSVEELYTNS